MRPSAPATSATSNHSRSTRSDVFSPACQFSVIISRKMAAPREQCTLGSRVNLLWWCGGNNNSYHSVRPIWGRGGLGQSSPRRKFFCLCNRLYFPTSEYKVSLSRLFLCLARWVSWQDVEARAFLSKYGAVKIWISSTLFCFNALPSLINGLPQYIADGWFGIDIPLEVDAFANIKLSHLFYARSSFRSILSMADTKRRSKLLHRRSWVRCR